MKLFLLGLFFCGTLAAAQAMREVQSVQVRGATIRVGDLFDDVVAVLKPGDRIAPPAVTRDGNDSLIVTHTYHVDRQTIRLEARRREDPGPYRVSRLWTDAQ